MAQKSRTRRKPRPAPAGSGGGAVEKPAKARPAVAPPAGRTSRLRRTKAPAPTARVRRPSGRYTAPIPRSVKRSPSWYPWVLLSLLFVGIVAIILNYIGLLPASPTNWYVVGGLIAILAGALMATGYR